MLKNYKINLLNMYKINKRSVYNISIIDDGSNNNGKGIDFQNEINFLSSGIIFRFI